MLIIIVLKNKVNAMLSIECSYLYVDIHYIHYKTINSVCILYIFKTYKIIITKILTGKCKYLEKFLKIRRLKCRNLIQTH